MYVSASSVQTALSSPKQGVHYLKNWRWSRKLPHIEITAHVVVLNTRQTYCLNSVNRAKVCLRKGGINRMNRLHANSLFMFFECLMLSFWASRRLASIFSNDTNNI